VISSLQKRERGRVDSTELNWLSTTWDLFSQIILSLDTDGFPGTDERVQIAKLIVKFFGAISPKLGKNEEGKFSKLEYYLFILNVLVPIQLFVWHNLRRMSQVLHESMQKTASQIRKGHTMNA